MPQAILQRTFPGLALCVLHRIESAKNYDPISIALVSSSKCCSSLRQYSFWFVRISSWRSHGTVIWKTWVTGSGTSPPSRVEPLLCSNICFRYRLIESGTRSLTCRSWKSFRKWSPCLCSFRSWCYTCTNQSSLTIFGQVYAWSARFILSFGR